MDVALAEPVVQAVADAMAAGDTGYPHEPTYTHAVADFAAAHWGWRIDPGRWPWCPT